MDIVEFLPKQITVHAPELFENDHLLNFASTDVSYRRNSIENYKRTIEAAVSLKEIIGVKGPVPLVVNCGGFSSTGFMSPDEKNKSFEILCETVRGLEKDEVVFCAQTMPPFPWHFGGQQYHNHLRTPEEILAFCGATGVDVCLDTSHTMMASTYFNFDFLDCLRAISTVVQHIHLADSRGVDEEGVLLGHGDLPINELREILGKHYKDATIILETWQGHLNNGENFIRDLRTWTNC